MNTRSPAPEVESQQSRAAQALTLANSSPATQAACDLIRLVRSNSPAAKVLPTHFEAASADRGDWWSTGWHCDGQRFEMDLTTHGPSTSLMTNTGAPIHGDGILTIEVDGEMVMAALVGFRRDDPDSQIVAVGASIFELGPWTAAVIELLRRLQDGTDPRTGQRAA